MTVANSSSRWRTEARERVQRALGGAQSSAARTDPSARMFTRVRHRLALWYTAVLAVILVLSGVVLYLAMYAVLLGPVDGILRAEAVQQTRYWQQHGQPPALCHETDDPEPLPYLYACFDSSGKLIGNNPAAKTVEDYIAPGLAQAALRNPSASPLVDSVTSDGPGQPFGHATYQRYTYVVRDASGDRTLGVLQIGLDITQEIGALHTLLMLLLVIGAVTVLVCGIGGLLLARRTLAPARLAFARQQAFIADASHELRSPLTLMRADAEVLLRGRDRLSADDAPLLDDIVSEVEHMGVLAENLLTLARLDRGAYHIEWDVVDLRRVAANVAHRTHALAAQRGITLVTTPAGLAKSLVIGDRALLEELALILLDNGIKYNTTGGKVTLRTAREGAQAVLTVSDTGIGIAAEHLKRLGERFYRVDKARSRQLGGAGLGLSIARGIAAEHHGTLTLTSTPGRGTTATLRLPAAAGKHARTATR